MSIDLNGLVESLQGGLGEIPTVAIVLALLGGPTAALIGYRLIGMARRMRTAPDAEVAPLWVCQDCRSVNELRLSRCYRCGVERDATAEIEVILDQPAGPPAPFEVPAGSPFAAHAAHAAEVQQRRSVPVMAEPAPRWDSVAVGPGRNAGADAGADVPEPPATDEPAHLVEVDR
jgi:hypothetical protein